MKHIQHAQRSVQNDDLIGGMLRKGGLEAATTGGHAFVVEIQI